MKYAIIDIGSNSVRLMLWADGKTLYKKVVTTRLGEGLDCTRRIQPEPIARTAAAVSAFFEEGTGQGAEVRAFATAAVRSAENGSEFCEAVKMRCGLEIDVVSGEDEARLAYLGALGDREGGVIDIGGASTEIASRSFSISLNIGAVRLFDACGEDRDKLERRIKEELGLLTVVPQGEFYAVGGTASTLACLNLGLSDYDGRRLQGLPLTQKWVKDEADKLLSMPVAERKKLRGMDPKRADIIAGAALLLYEIMKKIRLEMVKFSDRDNLEGYLTLRGLI